MLYDDRGRVYRSIRYGVDPATGLITGQQDRDQYYDATGSLLRQEPAGAMEFEVYEYDIQGRRIESSDPLGHSRQMAYDAAGNQVATTDATYQVWTQAFDPLGRQVRKVNPLGEATRTSYDAAGRQASGIDGVGNSSHSDYDAAGRIFATTDPLDKITTFTYDADGNQLSVTDPNGNTTSSEYDYLDRRIKTIDPAGHNQQMVYNLAGETIVEIDAKGSSSFHSYHALGRRVATTDRLGFTTTFAFNARGLLASLTDAENQTTAYVYDDYARQVETIWPDHVAGSNPGDIGYGITRQAYDDLNRLTRKTDQLGVTISFVYDAAGRLLSRDYRNKANSPIGSINDSDSFTYDAASRMLTANSGRYQNSVAFAYDTAGRKISESFTMANQTYVVGTEYDAAGRESKLIYPDDCEVHRSYTARGQLYQVSQKIPGGSLTVIDTRVYDDAGRMISSSYGNGVSQMHSYNSDNTLSGIAFNGAAIGNLAYTWDANHNKLSESISGAMSSYGFTASYDAEDRLISYDGAANQLDQSWNLSPVGDWASVTHSRPGLQPVTQTRTYGPAHELLTTDNNAVTHDAKGNMTLLPAASRTGGQSLGLNWDFDNRLSTADVGSDGSVEVTQIYDALGRRVARAEAAPSTGTRVFVHSGQHVLVDYIWGGAPSGSLFRYVWGSYVDEALTITYVPHGTRYYYHRNQQYSVVALSDAIGNLVEQYSYSAYGIPTVHDSSGAARSYSYYANRYRYTGREWDDVLHLYHYRARMYDPAAGRFCSRDPIGYRGSAFLLYLYVGSSPMQNIDFMGTKSCKISKTGSDGALDVLSGDTDERARISVGIETYAFTMRSAVEINSSCSSLNITATTNAGWATIDNATKVMTQQNHILKSKAKVTASCKYDESSEKCKVHIAYDPDEDEEEDTFGLYIKSSLSTHADVSDADYNDEGTCVTLSGKSKSKFTAGWDFETPAGSPKNTKSGDTSAKVTSRVCCECGECKEKT